MKLYSVLCKYNEQQKIEDIKFIKDGFSFKALFFNALWFVYYKMWKEVFAVILVNICLFFLAKFFLDFDKLLIEIAFAVMIAMNANFWLAAHFKKQGYKITAVIFGNNLADAEFRFVKNLKSSLKSDEFYFDDKILNPQFYS